jgi:hypothetical protein
LWRRKSGTTLLLAMLPASIRKRREEQASARAGHRRMCSNGSGIGVLYSPSKKHRAQEGVVEWRTREVAVAWEI